MGVGPREGNFAFMTDFYGNFGNITEGLEEVRKRGDVSHLVFGGGLAPYKRGAVLNDGLCVGVSGLDGRASFASCEQLFHAGYIPVEVDLESDFFLFLEDFRMMVREKRCAHMRGSFSKLREEDFKMFLDLLGQSLDRFFCSDEGRQWFDQYRRGAIARERDLRRGPFVRTAQMKEFLMQKFKYEFLYAHGWMGDQDYIREVLFDGNEYTDDQFLDVVCASRDRFTMDHLCQALEACDLWQLWDISQLELNQLDVRRRFLEIFLDEIGEFRNDFRGTVSVIMGENDPDLIPYLDVAEREGVIFHASNRVVDLGQGLNLIGFSGRLDTVADKAGLTRLRYKVGQSVRHLLANIHLPPRGVLAQGVDPQLRQSVGFVKAFLEGLPYEGVSLHGNGGSVVANRHQVWDKIGKVTAYAPGSSEYALRMIFGNVAVPFEYDLIGPHGKTSAKSI